MLGSVKPYAEHRKARYQYEVLDRFEGGLVLTGGEVKSIRSGGLTLNGSYVRFLRGELWLIGAHIRRYSKAGTTTTHEAERSRKILVRDKERRALLEKIQQKGLTLVPFSVYPKGRRLKISFGLCRGKKQYDKREALKLRETTRQTARFLKGGDQESWG